MLSTTILTRTITKSRPSRQRRVYAGKTFLQTFFFFLLVTQICFAQLELFTEEPLLKISSKQSTIALTGNIDSIMLDSIITAYMLSENIPGAATLIIKNNEVIWNKNYGYRNLQYQLPVEDSTLFLMASISKTILATAILQLWENGLINLDGNINDYLPSGFTVVNPYYPGVIITVKMLMTHTSSIQDNWSILENLWGCGDFPVTFEYFLINYFTPGGAYYTSNNFFNYPPGQNYNYTNAGTCLLALMVEHLSGKSFNEYTRDSIFTPLSMNASSWFLAGLDTNEIATPYLIHQPFYPLCQTGMAYWPIGQLRTNKFELSNFLSAYMNGGVFNSNRILDSATISLMLSDHLGYPLSWGVQGLIWYTDPSIYNTVWGHSGGWYGAETYMCVNQQEEWGFTFFINWASPPNYSAGFFATSIQIANYAHLYGNIYALHPSMDKFYAKLNVDSVLFLTRFSNIYNHQFVPHLIYTNSDSTEIDSLTLFDDGLHGDSLSSDGIYGGYIPPLQTESFFSLQVSTIDNQNNKYFKTPVQSKFATAGPVKLDSISIKKSFSLYNARPYIRNLGTTAAISNVTAKLTCNDPWIMNLQAGPYSYPKLTPGVTFGSTANYSFKLIDTLFPGYYNFKVEIMWEGLHCWTDSIRIVTSIEDEVQQPLTFKLEQNFPNPFNPSTRIQYQVSSNSHVSLKVYDVLGSKIATLVNEEKEAGYHSIDFNASDLPSGVYFYQLKSGSFIGTKKMILLR